MCVCVCVGGGGGGGEEGGVRGGGDGGAGAEVVIFANRHLTSRSVVIIYVMIWPGVTFLEK